MARMSLPVPVAPWIKMVASLSATTEAISKIFCMVGLLPTISW